MDGLSGTVDPTSAENQEIRVPRPLVSRSAGALEGTIVVPGDKSISHRALMLGSLAVGESEITGLLEGEDVLRTAEAMRALGAHVRRESPGQWRVAGCGTGGLAEPDNVLDMGNSGTAARLLIGLLATHPFVSTLTGDASLRRRPMRRVTDPLSMFGARFVCREGGRLPITIEGTDEALPVNYRLPVASAQVKSAVLLAGLNAPGVTTVREPRATRDHTERMLTHFGVLVAVFRDGAETVIEVTGEVEMTARDVRVPGDISSAAFPLVAAAIRPGSAVTVRNVGLNPLRAGILETLRDMGAAIRIDNVRTEAGEPVGDVSIDATELRGVDVPPERVPAMIDEFPILAVAAACAAGTTRMTGLAELRVKESDRLSAMAEGLSACGVALEEGQDSLTIHGTGHPPQGGAMIAVDLDHRIAMSFLVLGGATGDPVAVDDAAPIDTSFPGFADLMNGLGLRIADVITP